LAKDPARRPQSFVEIAERLDIASPKTVRAQRAIQPPTIPTAPGFPTPPTATGTSFTTGTSTTLPPIPRPAGLSAAKIAVIIGSAAVLFFVLLGAIGVWYFVSRKPAPKTAATQQSATVLPAIGAGPPPSNTNRSSGMAETAKDVNPFKNPTRPQSKLMPTAPPSAPNPQNPANAQPVAPLNDFTGG
jgi:hypothetical protein